MIGTFNILQFRLIAGIRLFVMVQANKRPADNKHAVSCAIKQTHNSMKQKSTTARRNNSCTRNNINLMLEGADNGSVQAICSFVVDRVLVVVRLAVCHH